MITITPTNNYSTNFKAKTDYSKIYKEMGKISLQQDEKIIPKKDFKNRFVKLKEKMDGTKKSISRKIYNLIPILLIFSPFILEGSLLSWVEHYTSKRNENYNKAVQVILKVDSLNTALDNKTISFDEYRKQMKNLVKNTK